MGEGWWEGRTLASFLGTLNTGKNMAVPFPSCAQPGSGFLLLPWEATVKAVQLKLLFVHIPAQLLRAWGSSGDLVSDKEFCFLTFC